jgi:hypothetical protein
MQTTNNTKNFGLIWRYLALFGDQNIFLATKFTRANFKFSSTDN